MLWGHKPPKSRSHVMVGALLRLGSLFMLVRHFSALRMLNPNLMLLRPKKPAMRPRIRFARLNWRPMDLRKLVLWWNRRPWMFLVVRVADWRPILRLLDYQRQHPVMLPKFRLHRPRFFLLAWLQPRWRRMAKPLHWGAQRMRVPKFQFLLPHFVFLSRMLVQ